MLNGDHQFSRFKNLFESLEERVLFDAVPDGAIIQPDVQIDMTIPAQTQQATTPTDSAPIELLIVDPGVSDVESLLAEIVSQRPQSQLEIRILDANQDGVSQIGELLSKSERTYDAIHIISHGDEGQVHLGNSLLSSDNLSGYASDLAGWSGALSADADILFYGCELAGNAEGEQFIESISAITGADVAASDDLTGAQSLGGDWELERRPGRHRRGRCG